MERLPTSPRSSKLPVVSRLLVVPLRLSYAAGEQSQYKCTLGNTIFALS